MMRTILNGFLNFPRYPFSIYILTVIILCCSLVRGATIMDTNSLTQEIVQILLLAYQAIPTEAGKFDFIKKAAEKLKVKAYELTFRMQIELRWEEIHRKRSRASTSSASSASKVVASHQMHVNHSSMSPVSTSSGGAAFHMVQSPTPNGSSYCNFCKLMGYARIFFTGHNWSSPTGEIVCPAWNYMCNNPVNPWAAYYFKNPEQYM